MLPIGSKEWSDSMEIHKATEDAMPFCFQALGPEGIFSGHVAYQTEQPRNDTPPRMERIG
jgi:hypothetical protein